MKFSLSKALTKRDFLHRNAKDTSAYPKSGFESLPTELIRAIFCSLKAPKDIQSLSYTCKRFYSIAQQLAWPDFVKQWDAVISASIPPSVKDANDVARSLTALNRNWTRKSYIARNIAPLSHDDWKDGFGDHYQLNIPKIIHEYSQNCKVLVESHEEIVGSNWRDRRELVVWTAGPHLICRKSVKGCQNGNVGQLNETSSPPPSWGVSTELDISGRGKFLKLSAIKLLKTSCNLSDDDNGSFRILIGNTFGTVNLSQINLNSTSQMNLKSTSQLPVASTIPAYSMESRGAVLSIDADSSEESALFCQMSQLTYVRLNTRSTSQKITWPKYDSTEAKFLSPTTVIAATLGTGGNIAGVAGVHSFKVTPTGFRDDEPDPYNVLRNEARVGDICNTLLPLTASRASNHPDTLFLAGTSKGHIALCDIRAPVAQNYFCIDDSSAIESLLIKGEIGFAAAANTKTSLSLSTRLSFFDFRNPEMMASDVIIENWRLEFDPQPLKPRPSLRHLGLESLLGKPMCQSRASLPIYSISSPSPYSPTIYLGSGRRVIQLDLIDPFDTFPDSLYHKGNFDPRNARKFWDPYNAAIGLSGFQSDSYNGKQPTEMPWKYKPENKMLPIDSRWFDSQEG